MYVTEVHLPESGYSWPLLDYESLYFRIRWLIKSTFNIQSYFLGILYFVNWYREFSVNHSARQTCWHRLKGLLFQTLVLMELSKTSCTVFSREDWDKMKEFVRQVLFLLTLGMKTTDVSSSWSGRIIILWNMTSSFSIGIFLHRESFTLNRNWSV